MLSCLIQLCSPSLQSNLIEIGLSDSYSNLDHKAKKSRWLVILDIKLVLLQLHMVAYANDFSKEGCMFCYNLGRQMVGKSKVCYKAMAAAR